MITVLAVSQFLELLKQLQTACQVRGFPRTIISAPSQCLTEKKEQLICDHSNEQNLQLTFIGRNAIEAYDEP